MKNNDHTPSMCSDDIFVDGDRYRYHVGHDEIIIKKQTFGGELGYGGWSFHAKFAKDNVDEALDAWRNLYNRREPDPVPDTATLAAQAEKHEHERKKFLNAEKNNKPVTTDLAKRGNSKLDTVSNLQPVAEQINAEFATYKEIEKDATKSMLKIGLMLEFANEQLPHGQLMKWAERNLTISYKHASRFRKIAQFFIKANQLQEGEAFALVDPANSQAALADKLQQMAFDFLGDKTQAELFAEYGIQVREPKQVGGARTPNPKPLPDGETLAHHDAFVAVGGLLKALDVCCLSERRVIVHLQKSELEGLEGALVSALKNIRDLIKAG